MKTLCILLIRAYQFCLSPLLGNCCRFHPTCSAYAVEALEKYGVWHGLKLALLRLCRCHPWHKGGFDPLQ